MHPVGLEFRISHPGNDVATWAVTAVVYNGIVFPDAAALIVAYNNGAVNKLHHVYDDELKAAGSFVPRGTPRFLENLPPPGTHIYTHQVHLIRTGVCFEEKWQSTHTNGRHCITITAIIKGGMRGPIKNKQIQH
jgi:hypothetical protein